MATCYINSDYMVEYLCDYCGKVIQRSRGSGGRYYEGLQMAPRTTTYTTANGLPVICFRCLDVRPDFKSAYNFVALKSEFDIASERWEEFLR